VRPVSRLVLLLLVLLPGAGLAAAADGPQSLFERAAGDYRDGHYDEASKGYEAILAQGI
jgi:hypothetical protein